MHWIRISLIILILSLSLSVEWSMNHGRKSNSVGRLSNLESTRLQSKTRQNVGRESNEASSIINTKTEREVTVRVISKADPVKWFDEDGFIHHLPNPNVGSSENRVLFTAYYEMLGGMTVASYYRELREKYNTNHMSHDNATGIMCGLKMKGYSSPIDIFDRARMHPRDIVMYGYGKYPLLFYPLLWIPSISMIISCAQTYKVRGGNKIIKTDGKLLTFLRHKAFGFPLTFKICTWLIERNPHFGSWTNVAKIYFREENHPIPIFMSRWENILK